MYPDDTKTIDDAALRLARETLKRERPEELPIFEAIGPDILAQARKHKTKASIDDPMGFGVENAMDFLTPVVALICARAATFLYDVAYSTAKDALKARILAWLDGGTSPELSAEDEARLREVLLKELKKRYSGVDSSDVADKVIVSLRSPKPR